MKCLISLAFTLLFAITLVAFPFNIFAQMQKSCFRVLGGFNSLTLQGREFSHNTHPDDFFLPDSDVPGSAGTTEIGRVNFIPIGLGYKTYLSTLYAITFDAGFLIALENNRDIHQNDNDSRHPFNAAFVYSEVDWGIFSDISFQYHLNSFYFGIEIQLEGVIVDSGWDRFNSDQNTNYSMEFVPSIGPQIGYKFIEGTVQFGNGVDYGIIGVYYF